MVRTCPACGEDTKAGYAEACTKCGFSPAGEQMPDASIEPEPEPELTVGEPGDPPPPDGPPAEEEAGDQQPAETETKKKKRPAVRGLVWLVVIGAAIGADRLGVFDGATGPDADQVEQAIADDAARQFGVQVTVDCPDDADQTEVEASFSCTATSASGQTVTIKVTNHEDTFEWQSGALSTLA